MYCFAVVGINTVNYKTECLTTTLGRIPYALPVIFDFVLQFVIPTADYAATLLLKMGKERPKHVELLSFENKTIYCDIKLDIHTYFQ
jgi:hypothetical protein